MYTQRLYVIVLLYVHVYIHSTFASVRFCSTPGMKALVNLTQDEPMAPAKVETIPIVVIICGEKEGGSEMSEEEREREREGNERGK